MNSANKSYEIKGVLGNYALEQSTKIHWSSRVFLPSAACYSSNSSTGRTLDFIISQRSESIIKSTLVAHCFISDHASITCSLLPAEPASKVKTLSYRETKSVDFKHLSADIADSDLYNMSEVNTTSCDQRPDELVRNYNSTLSHLLDRHAPPKTNTILVRPSVSWYTDETFSQGC